MDHPAPASRLVSSANCSHLRHKGMYVLAEPDTAASRFYDGYDATAYWCTCTQRAIGPDGEPATASRCQAGRECCEH